MSIHAVRKRAAGFSNVKSFADITLELVDEVHGFYDALNISKSLASLSTVSVKSQTNFAQRL